MKNKKIGALLMIIATVIWGSAFVAQHMGGAALPAFAFTGARSFIGAAAVLPLAVIMGRQDKKAGRHYSKKVLVIGGIVCGVILAVASSLQQYGVTLTSAGKAGFITALYIIIVPLLGIFCRRRVGWTLWISVAIAAVGLYLISIKDNFTMEVGDLFVLFCAFAFSVHILVISFLAGRVNGIHLSCIQLVTAGVICTVCSLIFEKVTFAQLISAWAPLLYVGVLSSGVAFTLQIISQESLDPTVASLLMSLESVFAALSGWLILGESLSQRELLGCALVFCAVLLAQLPAPKKRLKSPAGAASAEKSASENGSGNDLEKASEGAKESTSDIAMYSAADSAKEEALENARKK